MGTDVKIQWNIGSDHVLRLTLLDDTGLAVTGAAITVTISKRDGTQLIQDTMIDSGNGDGKYTLPLDNTVINSNEYHEILVEAVAGGIDGTWKDVFPADYAGLW